MARVSNPVFLTVLDPVDPNLLKIFKKSAPKIPKEIYQPFQVDNRGGIATDTDTYHRIGQHLLSILFTRAGERVMRPTYGIGVQNDLFESNDLPTTARIASSLKAALTVWEPEATLVAVTGAPDPTNAGVMLITVNYAVNSTGQQHSMVFALDGTRVEI